MQSYVYMYGWGFSRLVHRRLWNRTRREIDMPWFFAIYNNTIYTKCDSRISLDWFPIKQSFPILHLSSLFLLLSVSSPHILLSIYKDPLPFISFPFFSLHSTSSLVRGILERAKQKGWCCFLTRARAREMKRKMSYRVLFFQDHRGYVDFANPCWRFSLFFSSWAFPQVVAFAYRRRRRPRRPSSLISPEKYVKKLRQTPRTP